MLTKNFRQWWYSSPVLLFTNIYTSSVYAQAINLVQSPRPNSQITINLPRSQDTTPPHSIVPETPTKIPSLSPPLQLPTSPTPEKKEQLPEGVPQFITVTKFEFEGNKVFNDSELNNIVIYEDKSLSKLTNQKLSLSQLLEIAAKISDYYKKHGYATSGAVISIPEATKNNIIDKETATAKGTVTIKVIEDRIKKENIKVLAYKPQDKDSEYSNNDKPKHLRLNPEYVRSRLAIVTSKPLNIERLKEALQILRINGPIENIFAEISAGSVPGESILTVQVQEAENFDIPLRINNSRSPSAGSFQRQIGFSHKNFFGWGDTLVANYNNTDGSNGVDFSYTLPINPYNGSLNFSYTNSYTHVIEPPFDQLDIKSNSRTYDFTLRQPISQAIKNQSYQEFAIGTTFSRKESEASLLGIPYPLSAGADNQGKTRISALRFFQEWTQQNSHEVIAVRSQFNFGIGAFNVNINQPIAGEVVPDNRFYYWQGQAQYVHIFAPETLLLFRSNIQIAGRTLVPLEQFSLGGFGSVRGYRQDTILGDNGVFGSVEFQYPFLRIPKWKTRFLIIPFTDYGTAWDSSGKSIDPRSLESIGLGLKFLQGDHLTARLDYGIPIKFDAGTPINIDFKEKTWQEDGLTFIIEWKWNPF